MNWELLAVGAAAPYAGLAFARARIGRRRRKRRPKRSRPRRDFARGGGSDRTAFGSFYTFSFLVSRPRW